MQEEFSKFKDIIIHKLFDFQKECLSYCTSDVDLLMRGCLSFRENMKLITKTLKTFKT